MSIEEAFTNEKRPNRAVLGAISGGEGGIRTLGRVAPTPDFESGTFDHSATSPDSVLYVEALILSGPKGL